MQIRRLAPLAAAALLTAAAAARPDGLEFDITGPASPQPGSAFEVSVYVNVPVNGTVIPWTTMGGTGQPGTMLGFSSANFNVVANTGAWSNMTLGPGLILGDPPPVPVGSTIRVQAVIGFGPPLPGPRIFLWSARLTLPGTPMPPVLTFDTFFLGIGSPPNGPYRGIEVLLSGILPPLNVSHYLTGLPDAHATIPLPAPGCVSLFAAAGFLAAHRKRPAPAV